MSYSALGNGVGVSCARLQTMMPGTGTYMPGQICGDIPSKTGHHPPRPRICGGAGILDVQNGLKLAGIYFGPVDGTANPQFLAAVAGIAAAYNVPWDGDLFTVSPALCGAIIAEVSKRAPACPSATHADIGCVVKPTGPLMDPLPAEPSAAPERMRKQYIPAPTAQQMMRTYPRTTFTKTTVAPMTTVSTVEGDVADGTATDTTPPATEKPVGEAIPKYVYAIGAAITIGTVAYLLTR